MIKVNYSYALAEKELQKVQNKALYAFDTLVNKTGAGNDYLGWLDYPKHQI